MKSLLIYLKNYKKESILAPVFKMLEATFELVVPLVMAAVIDVGIANRDRSYVVHMCLVLILLGIVGLVSSITAQYFAAKAATGFATQLRHAFFEHVQKLSFSQMDTIGTDTLITRMTSDINQAQSGVNMVLRLFLRSPFIVLGAMVMAFTVDVKAALVFVVTIPVLSVIVFGIMLITLPKYKKVQSYLDQVLQSARENLTGARVIRAFHREEEETKQFEDRTEALASAQKHVGKISGLMNPLTYVTINFAIVVLIYVGAVRVDSGALTQGAVVALLNYMSQILVELIKLANLIITVTRAAASGNRVADILAIEPDMEYRQTGMQKENDTVSDLEKQPVVAFENVSLTYPGGGDPALQQISFTAYAGQTIGIIGGTGSGKSSLVNLIPRFYDVTDGSVKVMGEDVRLQETEKLRSKVGMVFQKAELFKGTIADNLRWGYTQATKQDMEDALEASQAREFVDSKPGRTEFLIEQNGRNLSGGQKQRMTIARALIRKPEILILDDSASALDFATDAKLRQAIRKMHSSMTIFIVSQRAASIREADQILVLDEGRIAGIGSHEMLLKENAVYQEIYYSQFPREEEDHAE